MLSDASSINGYAIEATDGRLGIIGDSLFEDIGWIIRWLVVDTGNWLSGRKIPTTAFSLGSARCDTEPVSRESDDAAGQRQPRYRYESTCVASDANSCLRLLRVGTLLEWQKLGDERQDHAINRTALVNIVRSGRR